MMFASKTPRDLNHDPLPWVSWDVRYPRHIGTAYFDPRPELDHVQHNAVNRRLTSFRKELSLHHEAGPEVGLPMHRLAESWVDRNDGAEDVSDEEFRHSQKVLERLARSWHRY